MNGRTEPREIVLSERATFGIGIAAGIVLRAIQLATSIGHVDVYYWSRHLDFAEKFGVLGAYRASRVINHPSLSMELALLTKKLGAAIGLQFFDAFRILQSVADVVTAIALLAIARRVGREDGVWIALVFFLSPTAIFVSAFHCNSDSTMVMLVALAMLATVTQRPIVAGLLIAAACGIKIIAFAALPLLLFGLRGRKARVLFLVASAVAGALIFVPPLFVSGWVAIRNIFGYTGWRGGWGFPLVLNLIGYAAPQLALKDSGSVVTPVFIFSLLLLWSVEAWRVVKRGDVDAQRLVSTSGLAFLLVLFLAPGFGPQYLVWMLPCLAFLFPRRATLELHALAAIFVFWLYTSWSDGWPWTYADGRFRSPAPGMFGVIVWIAIGWAVFAGVRSLYFSEKR